MADEEETKKPAAKKTAAKTDEAKVEEVATEQAEKKAAPKKAPAKKTEGAEEKAAPAAKKAPAKKAEAPAEPAAKKESNGAPKSAKRVSRVLESYNSEVVPAMVQKFGYKNPMEVPKLVKIIVSTGLGDIKDNPKAIQNTTNELKAITGQQPKVCKARKSVANFKLRTGMVVGLQVTLRRDRMYDFYDKLVSIALPRVRDFRGLPTESFDGRGNYSIGLKEQLIFPEIVYDQVEKVRGMNINFVTTAKTDEEARELLRAMGMPFKK